MDSMDEQITQLRELMRSAGEFIAYFELVDSKMLEWRQAIENRAAEHHEQMHQAQSLIENQINTLTCLLTQTGLSDFRTTLENALNQANASLLSVQEGATKAISYMTNHKEEIKTLTESALTQIVEHTAEAMRRIDAQLSEYDIQHFQRIAHESCGYVERSARNAILKSKVILRLFQWRSVGLALLTTLLTTFVLSLYVSNEYPWETHRHAVGERHAGKILIQSWPMLSDQEKIKILKSHSGRLSLGITAEN